MPIGIKVLLSGLCLFMYMLGGLCVSDFIDCNRYTKGQIKWIILFWPITVIIYFLKTVIPNTFKDLLQGIVDTFPKKKVKQIESRTWQMIEAEQELEDYLK